MQQVHEDNHSSIDDDSMRGGHRIQLGSDDQSQLEESKSLILGGDDANTSRIMAMINDTTFTEDNRSQDSDTHVVRQNSKGGGGKLSTSMNSSFMSQGRIRRASHLGADKKKVVQIQLDNDDDDSLESDTDIRAYGQKPQRGKSSLSGSQESVGGQIIKLKKYGGGGINSSSRVDSSMEEELEVEVMSQRSSNYTNTSIKMKSGSISQQNQQSYSYKALSRLNGQSSDSHQHKVNVIEGESGSEADQMSNYTLTSVKMDSKSKHSSSTFNNNLNNLNSRSRAGTQK